MAANTHSLSCGTSDYASIASAVGIDGGTITIEGWLYFASAPSSGANFVIASQENASTHVGYAIRYYNNGGTLQIDGYRVKEFVAVQRVTYNVTLATDTWHHLAFTYDGTNMRLYNAVVAGGHTLRGTVAASGNGTTSADTYLYVGAGGACLVDDVRIWNDARSLAELDDNDETQTFTETNLAAYYQFNNDLTDSSGNGYTMSNVGSPTYSTTVPFSDSANYPLTAEVGSLAITGVTTVFGIKMPAAVSSLVISGVDAAVGLGKTIVAGIGTFIITGVDAALRYSGWVNESKNTSSWTPETKNTSSWTDETKNTSSWTDETKN